MRLTGKNRGKVLCDKCHQPLHAMHNDAVGTIVCSICGLQYTGALFKVADQFITHSGVVTDVRDMEDAQCFFHPGKEAVEVCSVCGRMMCSLCDISQSVGHICPSCINDRKRTDIDGLPRRSWAYMQMAWGLLLLNLVIPVIPACISLFFSIAGLRNNGYAYSTGRKVSLAFAALLALPSIAAIPLLIVMAVLG